jgi:aspartate racemase
MPQHIGIVACSAEGAAPLQPHYFPEGADLLGRHSHPEISMHARPFAEYVKCICAKD